MRVIDESLLTQLFAMAKRDPRNKLRVYKGRIECFTCGGIDVPWNDTRGHDNHVFVYLDEDMWD